MSVEKLWDVFDEDGILMDTHEAPTAWAALTRQAELYASEMEGGCSPTMLRRWGWLVRRAT